MQTRSNSDSKLYSLVLAFTELFTEDLMTELESATKNTLEAWGCRITEFYIEDDRACISFEAPSGVKLPNLVENLKSVHWGTNPQAWKNPYCRLTVTKM